jgi:hypothetical protein
MCLRHRVAAKFGLRFRGVKLQFIQYQYSDFGNALHPHIVCQQRITPDIYTSCNVKRIWRSQVVASTQIGGRLCNVKGDW